MTLTIDFQNVINSTLNERTFVQNLKKTPACILEVPCSQKWPELYPIKRATLIGQNKAFCPIWPVPPYRCCFIFKVFSSWSSCRNIYHDNVSKCFKELVLCARITTNQGTVFDWILKLFDLVAFKEIKQFYFWISVIVALVVTTGVVEDPDLKSWHNFEFPLE